MSHSRIETRKKYESTSESAESKTLPRTTTILRDGTSLHGKRDGNFHEQCHIDDKWVDCGRDSYLPLDSQREQEQKI